MDTKKPNIKLVKLSWDYKPQLEDMMGEWLSLEQDFSPYAIRRLDYRDFAYYLENLERKEEGDGLVPDSTFFCLDIDRNIFVGAVNIRHYLNESLLHTGGHIGDGVRPLERRKGYATAMIGLALEECRRLGIFRVLMTCDRDNIGSARSIIANGGVLENEVEEDGIIEQRYWIDLADYRALFHVIYPGFFEDAQIRARSRENVSEEMALWLDSFRADALDIPVPEGISFGEYHGDFSLLREAVARVEEGWLPFYTPGCRAFCAMDGENIASFCIIEQMYGAEGQKPRIGGPGCVGTVPAYRRRGIGLKMVQHVTQILKEEGYDISFIHYTGVAPWYAKLGYKTVLRWNCEGFLDQ